MRVSSDARRFARCDVFEDADHDINVVELYQGSICGWHRHQRQRDDVLVVSGAVQFGTWNGVDAPAYRVVRSGNKVWGVQPGLWHGYRCLSGPAIMVTRLSRKYDPTDEERRAVEPGHFPMESA